MSENRKMPKSLYAKSANELLGAVGLDKSFQGKQLYKWLNTGVVDFKEMTNLPKTIREFLSSAMGSPLSSKVIEVQEDGSDATKLAIELCDGKIIEAVILSDDNGRSTACLSSQVGCAMGCAFCTNRNDGF